MRNQARRNSVFRIPRAVQRGASYVEHLVLIGIIALALMGAFRGLQQAYTKLSGDEGRAIATLEWSASAKDSGGPLVQPPNHDSGDEGSKDSDSKKKCDGWWDCAKEHAKDFVVEFGKAAKDDVVGMVTGTATLVHKLVTDPKGVYEDGKALVDAIRKDPVGALKQLVWDDETSKLWANGDYGGALGRTLWNVGSNFIPYGGQAAKASKISKLANAAEKVRDVAKAGDKAHDVAKAADKAHDAAKAADKGKDGAKAADKANDGAKAGDKASDGSKTAEHGAEKPSESKKPGDKPDDGAEKRADNSKGDPECEGGVCKTGQKCFAAGTLVLTAAGNRPIESLKVGELVWSRDEHGGEIGLRPITHVFVTPNKSVLNLTVETERDIDNLTVTPGHPFWVEGAGWVPSDELVEGATLWSPEGLRHLHHGAPSTERITVYNLEVEGFHTYFVGKLHTWVHNQGRNNCDRAKVANFQRKVEPDEIEKAPASGPDGREGHYDSHNVSKRDLANVVNNPDRIFSGRNYNGRNVDIYYKNGSCVVTEAGKKNSVITGYGNIGRPRTKVSPERWSDPSRWQTDTAAERYVEISTKPGEAFEVTYLTREGFEEGWYK